MKIKKVQTKSIITKSNLPDVDWVINPYTGCSHGCIYCYADFMKRFTGHVGEDWGKFVDVKINAADTINPKKISEGQRIVIGSVTDPYQSIESKYKITRQCLEKLSESGAEIEIITKSPLVTRDIDLFKKFKKLKVVVSLGILNEKASRKLEPCASSPKQRIEALKKLHEGGIKTTLFVSPIFPEISDVGGLIDLTKDFVDEYYFENLNVRANNRKRILDFVEGNYPCLLEMYSSLGKDYWEILRKEIIEKCKREGVNYKIYFYHGK